MKRYTSVDAFCGAGGLALGLNRAGFEIVSAFDYDKYAMRTFRANVSPSALLAKAEEVGGAELTQGLRRGERLDLFAGGPPCQGFSKQKRGAHLGDDRNNLIYEYVRLVRETNPRFFLLENVDQLGQKRGKGFVSHIQDELTDYVLVPHFYNTADYGLAQTRSRFVLIGKHQDVRALFRAPIPSVTKWATVGEVLAGLPEPPADYSEHPTYPNHGAARVTPINIERFSYVPQGGGWWDIPEHLRLECHKNVDRGSGGWPDVYGRLRVDGQAPTITGGFDSFTRGRYGHPLHDRPLTPREAARLQGFPDEFRFHGTRGNVRAQIGNAVPPPLAEAHGRAILDTLLVEDGERPADDEGYIRDVHAIQGTLALR